MKDYSGCYDEDFCIEDFCKDSHSDDLLDDLECIALDLSTTVDDNEEENRILRANLVAINAKIEKLEDGLLDDLE